MLFYMYLDFPSNILYGEGESGNHKLTHYTKYTYMATCIMYRYMYSTINIMHDIL